MKAEWKKNIKSMLQQAKYTYLANDSTSCPQAKHTRVQSHSLCRDL